MLSAEFRSPRAPSPPCCWSESSPVPCSRECLTIRGQRHRLRLSSLVDSRVWTLATGAFFAVTPLCYVAVIGSFAVLMGFAERRLGTRRAVLAYVYSHLIGILGAAALI